MIESQINGIEISIEVIVPSPWFSEAVRLLEENSEVEVGIHLALTSAWDNVKWRPLTEIQNLIDEDRYFFQYLLLTIITQVIYSGK